MRFINVVTAALLPIAALSSPLATTSISEEEAVALKFSPITTRDDDAEAVGLLKRSKSCDVVNVVTEVDCWWLPKHNGKGNHYVRSFKGTTNNIPFDCWTKCEKVGGITTWFWTYSSTLGGCYVPGYYLDNNCVSTGSGALPQCSFAAADRAQGGCA